MGQAIKIGGIDTGRMIGRWTSSKEAAKDATYVDLNNPFATKSVSIDPYCETIATPDDTSSVAIIGMEVTTTTIKLKFDKLEKATRFKCKVYRM